MKRRLGYAGAVLCGLVAGIALINGSSVVAVLFIGLMVLVATLADRKAGV